MHSPLPELSPVVRSSSNINIVLNNHGGGFDSQPLAVFRVFQLCCWCFSTLTLYPGPRLILCCVENKLYGGSHGEDNPKSRFTLFVNVKTVWNLMKMSNVYYIPGHSGVAQIQ